MKKVNRLEQASQLYHRTIRNLENNPKIRMYEDAVSWIAMNDEPTETKLEALQQQITIVLVADIFDMPVAKVAKDILKFRKTANII